MGFSRQEHCSRMPCSDLSPDKSKETKADGALGTEYQRGELQSGVVVETSRLLLKENKRKYNMAKGKKILQNEQVVVS